MRIYTRGGDKGTTSLIYGRRIRKDARRVQAYGNVDEANSWIGFATAALPSSQAFDRLRAMAARVQRDLFDVGRDLATPEEKRDASYITEADVALVERMIDTLDALVPPLQTFVLPGGHPAAAAFHVARTVTRRCERSLVSMQAEDPVQPAIQAYINRLSDWLFVAARYVNHETGWEEPSVDFQSQEADPFGAEHA
ncbi:MAG: cob(I)yrinic acid a,c-diamide adenosyltransferase [Alicyclobacillus sp.]|nr:cob(I)yrinic acid a,c-diamide adenosyltransferase [Alicyclobacillus sp.]